MKFIDEPGGEADFDVFLQINEDGFVHDHVVEGDAVEGEGFRQL